MQQDYGEYTPHGTINLQTLSRISEDHIAADSRQQQQQQQPSSSSSSSSNPFNNNFDTTTESRTSADGITTHEQSEETTTTTTTTTTTSTSTTMYSTTEETGGEFPTRPAPTAAATWDAKDYSDLEVVVSIPQTWNSNDKMPVLIDTSEEKIATPSTMHDPYGATGTTNTTTTVFNPSLLSPSLADPVPAYPTSIHSRSSTFTNTPLTKGGDYAEYHYQDGGDHARGGLGLAHGHGNGKQYVPEKRTWGMTNRQLSLVATGLLGFVLVLLGTVLAITLSMNNSHSDGKSVSVGVDPSSGLLNTSRLEALNWTDTMGLDRSLVFYQDEGNAILASIRDSVSNEWVVQNITQSVLNSTGAKRLDVLAGTPLASVTNLWQVSLYYLTTDNYVAELWCSDVAGGAWYAGSLATDLNPSAMNGSRLAAYWQVCTNCTNSLLVLHQQTDGNLMLANLTDGSWELSGPVNSASAVTNATGLALRPTMDGNSTNPTGLVAYGFESTGIAEFTANGSVANTTTWETEYATNSLSTTVTSSDPSPDLVAMTYGDQGWTNSVVTYLTSNGSLTSYVRNGTVWSDGGVPTITKQGSTVSPSSFSAIAGSQDLKMYAISNGTIYEYEIDEDDPLSWEFSSTVFTSDSS